MTVIQNFGISSIGLAIPSYALPLQELAGLRAVPATKYIDNLGCQTMALCKLDENVITLATKAARRAILNWKGDFNDIGCIAIGTESSVDMSRPLASWIMQELGLKGAMRCYEVKHACYGGTLALRQALEWKMSGNSKGKAALVIAADLALYAAEHSGEPTQGAGAVAFIIDEPLIASINRDSYYWSEPHFDFWRPVGHNFPQVNGRLSLTCYVNALEQCFAQLAASHELKNHLQTFARICCHVPFPKMVYKAIVKLGESCGMTATEIDTLYKERVLTTMAWNQQIGNSYTASLWFAVANALTQLQQDQQFAAFSYGSGYGSELLTITCTVNQATANWVAEFKQDLAQREFIDAAQYLQLRKEYELII